jgi:hypothetical protein
MGRSLWREDWSVVYNCCWPSLAQSFSGPSPLRLATIFYCLSFETSIFVASYDSQGHAGGLLPCVHSHLRWSDGQEDTFSKGSVVTVCLCTRCRVNAFTTVTQTMMHSLLSVVEETWLPIRCLAMDARSDSDIPSFRRNVTIYICHTTLHLYLGGVRFQSLPRHPLSWLRVFVVCFSPLRKCWDNTTATVVNVDVEWQIALGVG